MKTKWLAGIEEPDERAVTIKWKYLRAKNKQEAMQEADAWAIETGHNGKPHILVITEDDAEHVSALRYLDENQWIISGKGLESW